MDYGTTLIGILEPIANSASLQSREGKSRSESARSDIESTQRAKEGTKDAEVPKSIMPESLEKQNLED